MHTEIRLKTLRITLFFTLFVIALVVTLYMHRLRMAGAYRTGVRVGVLRGLQIGKGEWHGES